MKIITKFKPLGPYLIAMSCLFSFDSFADVLRYKDKQGRSHYVNSVEMVPERYRDQLENQSPLPSISKSESVEFDGVPAAQSSKKKVEIFVTSWCGYCRRMEAFLKANNVDFVKTDIEKDTAGMMRYVELFGSGGGVPGFSYGKEKFLGFDKARISKILGLKSKKSAGVSSAMKISTQATNPTSLFI